MRTTRIEGATRVLGKPADWDDSKGCCGDLYIREEEHSYGSVMLSKWVPNPDELKRLNEGCSVILAVCGTVHPPVSVFVE